MKSFMRMAIGFFVLCLVIFSFAYFFGPEAVRDSFHNSGSPVGQLKASDTLVSPGQPAESK
jgi:hypothetical protein